MLTSDVNIIDVDCNNIGITKEMKDIPINTYFIGTVGDCSGLFMKAYETIISINNPRNTWNNPTVENYQVVNVKISFTRLVK